MTTLTAAGGPPIRSLDGGISNDQFDALVYWLESSAVASPARTKTVGVTSCGRGAGVSTVAEKLAIAAAQVVDQPVLLIDISGTPNSRASRLAESGDSDAENIFDNGLAAARNVQPSKCSNLSLLALNSMQRSPRRNLGGRHISEMLTELEREFGFIVVDLPPADSGLCFALGATLSGVLLVVEAGQTDAESLSRATRRLHQANAEVFGIILNKYSHESTGWLPSRRKHSFD
jgi:succinoglycan biosynthesis transport protein ExoP